MLGINTDLTIEDTKKLLDKTGFGLFAIEKLIPSFDRVYGGVFYSPNILSYGLAALMCPLKSDIVLYGLANKDIQLPIEILKKYGADRIRVVSGQTTEIHYIDELNIIGTSKILDSKEKVVKEYNFGEVLNLPKYTENDIKQMENKIDNVKIIVDILTGKRDDAYVDLVCLNAGNILELSGLANTIQEGYYISKEHVKSGKAINKLIEIIEASDGKIENLKMFL